MKNAYKEKILGPDKLGPVVARLKAENKKIATLNGSFDLLHAGHLYIISEAAKCGDVLIVALNSDESIKRYKNPTRPIVPLCYRMEMIAALGFVDYVTFFEEDDPRSLLRQIKPHVHVNGIEYESDCIEADVVKEGGGILHLVDRIDSLSTSQIVEKIKTIH